MNKFGEVVYKNGGCPYPSLSEIALVLGNQTRLRRNQLIYANFLTQTINENPT